MLTTNLIIFLQSMVEEKSYSLNSNFRLFFHGILDNHFLEAINNKTKILRLKFDSRTK